MSLRKKPPCKKDGKDCEERHVGCHSHCKEFSDWKEAREEVLAKKRKDDTIRRQVEDSRYRCMKKIRDWRNRK